MWFGAGLPSGSTPIVLPVKAFRCTCAGIGISSGFPARMKPKRMLFHTRLSLIALSSPPTIHIPVPTG